jgi:serine protease Do
MHMTCVALAFFLSSPKATVLGPSPSPRHTPIVAAVQASSPSIVTVNHPRPGRTPGVGTGVVIDRHGYLLTARHVVGGARSVEVTLASGTALPADVIAVDRSSDLAILHVVTRETLIPMSLGTASDLMLGEPVIAIGNPFGYQRTVSTGIISGLGREITLPTGAILSGLIQTDASINPGNSGGPLLNVQGEMIGLVIALRDGGHGIAWAINVDMVREMLREHLPQEVASP